MTFHPSLPAFQAPFLTRPSRPTPPSINPPPSTTSHRHPTPFHARRLAPRPTYPPACRRVPLTASLASWDTLTRADFDARLASSSLALCLVGMSNSGKSHRSRQLHHALGFDLVSVDDLIEAALAPELAAQGHSGIHGLAAWMGFPADPRFARNQARYLQREEAATAAVRAPSTRNFVLDTTGSVVYLSDEVLRRVRREFLVVHLEASDDMLGTMTENYFKTPKPVVWGDAYRPREEENGKETLRRCYPGLLRERRERYNKLCHVAVPAAVSLSRELHAEAFLQSVRAKLKKA